MANININNSHITPDMTFKKLCYMNIQQLTNFPFLEEDFDFITDYQFICQMTEYLNSVIKNSNDQNDSITNLYNAFLDLQTYMNDSVDSLESAFNTLDDYVRNYFANLDVQDEINNKLDQMLEDGVLEQIIEQFIQSTALWCFDTVADMKLATNLINGSYAKTLGYYSVNDDGGANYKIRTKEESDVPDDMFLIAIGSTLVAELILDNPLNLKTIGLKSDDNTFDNSTILNSVLNDTDYSNYNFYVPNGTYYLLNSVSITRNCDGFILKGNGHVSDGVINSGTEFNYTGNDYAFIFNNRLWRSLLENFDIVSPTGSGIHFIGNISGSSINEIQLKVKNIGITCEKSGYSYWNNINITDNENSTEFIGYNFTSDNSYVTEYIYMNECTAGCYNGTYESTYSYGVKSNHLNHFYMENCDFVNLSYGFYLDAMGNSKYINLTTSNFTCNVSDLYLKSNLASISGVYISECSFSIRSSNSHVLTTERVSPRQTRGLIYANNHIADIVSGVTTDYLLNIGNNSLELSSCTITNNGYNANSTVPFINLPSIYNAYSPLSHSYIRGKIVGVQGDGTKTSYTEVLTSDSPFDYRPAVLVTDTKGYMDSYTITNTKGGELSVTINFSTTFSDRDYISIHVIGDCYIKNANI